MGERDYRLVSEVGVASPAELERDQSAMMRKQREQYGAPETTVDAVIFALRSRGMAALNEPITKQRLSELSKPQLAEVGVRLHRLRAKYPTITDQVIIKIGDYYEAD
jgi:hypothetical protein